MKASPLLPARSLASLALAGLLASLVGCAGGPTRSSASELSDAGPFASASDANLTPPVPRETVLPVHPIALRRGGVEGNVRVEGVIDATGRMRDLHVLEASSHEFIAPSLAALNRWTYEPARLDGAPVAVRVNIPVSYILLPE